MSQNPQTQQIQQIADFLTSLSPDQHEEVNAILADSLAEAIWLPLPGGPQERAFEADPEVDVIGYGGCVSADTEFLTPRGWRRIDQYRRGDLVAQVDDSGEVTYVAPLAYVNNPCDELIEFRTRRAAMALSPGHRMLLDDWKGDRVVRLAEDVEAHPSRYRIPVGFTPKTKGMPHTDAEIRLAVALHADGHMERHRVGDGRVEWAVGLRKQRKKDALVSLLTQLGIEWSEYHNPARPTEVRYRFNYWLDTKRFAGLWWDASPSQLRVILEEVTKWDGSDTPSGLTFVSTHKEDCDFIQYAAHVCGRHAHLGVSSEARGNHATCYRVFITRKEVEGVSLRVDGTQVSRIPTEDGRMYCFTLPTEKWVARRDGHIFLTMNSAGGGKTDLACGLALTKHKRTAIFRREATQLEGIYQRLEELVGSKDGFNGSNKIWRDLPGDRVIEFGSVPNPGDETKYQGRPKDLLVLDETANFLESQVRFLMGWVRTVEEGQHCTTLMTFNPPTTAEGQWVITFFGPWLQQNHPDPAMPGEIRYVGVVDGKDFWVEDGTPFVLVDGKPCYDFNPRDYQPEDIVKPQSRTFIPSKISDNPYLMATGYVATLQALPEPLRSQMLRGDFQAGLEDDVWQTIPSDWVRAAQERWEDKSKAPPPMLSTGVDVARGGRDQSVIQALHEGLWFARPVVEPGSKTPDGQTMAALILANTRNQAPAHIDIIGPGASPYDFLRGMGVHVVPMVGSERAPGKDKTGKFSFSNYRSWLYWMMREALDPLNNTGIALPPDDRLTADLCAPTFKVLTGGVIQLEPKDQLVKRIGRSPDFADAACYALVRTPKRQTGSNAAPGKVEDDWDPFSH